MANHIYLTIIGSKQGLISAGCCTLTSLGDKIQTGRKDQTHVLQFDHAISRSQRTQQHPIKFCKPIDKSSPRLGIAITHNEELELLFDFYRASDYGGQEKYYSIQLIGATLTDIAVSYPHALNHADVQPQEIISVTYKDIDWQEHIVGAIA